MGGHNGYKVVGPNGNSLFLPAAGERDGSDLYGAYGGGSGRYWSRTLYYCTKWDAYYLYLNSDQVTWSSDYRRYGLSVRPVLGF